LFRLKIRSNSGEFVLKCSKIARAFRFDLTTLMDVSQALVEETIAEVGEHAAADVWPAVRAGNHLAPSREFVSTPRRRPIASGRRRKV
jgi:hypothetical protein